MGARVLINGTRYQFEFLGSTGLGLSAYHRFMADSHPADELKLLRDMLSWLETGELKMVFGHKDVSQREMGILKREIAFLEKTLERLKEQNAGRPKR